MMRAGARGIPHAFIVNASNTIVFSGHPMEPGFESALRTAAAEASDRVTAKAQEPLPLVTDSLEELLGRPVKELKQILTDRGLSTADCVEKADLAKKIVEMCSKTTYYR